MTSRFKEWLFGLSAVGLLLGGFLFAASLTPSLLPRGYQFQGVLGGFAFSFGYIGGRFLQGAWRFLEMPVVPERLWRAFVSVAALVSGLVILLSLGQAAIWQNALREMVEMPPVVSAHPFWVAGISLGTALVILGVLKLIGAFMSLVSRRFYTQVPRRVSFGVGALVSVAILAMLADGLVVRWGLGATDDMFRLQDMMIDPDLPPPSQQSVSGSAASLIRWDEMGAAGRQFVSRGPDVETITGWTNQPAKSPLRVYVGLNAANTSEERAEIALQELIRVGGFERKVLVIATPTGTGWMDPAAFDTLEILHGGDVATVATQYSYLSSYVSLMVEPETSAASARALFNAVYGHWKDLPEETRPNLYLFGISLGAYGSENSAHLHEMLADPVQGALWAGPPFLNRIRREVTRARNTGTPAWLPEFGDGSVVRFKNQHNDISGNPEVWGPLRIVYLQYASDPVVFFEPSSFYREPEGMKPRGPDVSEQFQWVPVVTFLQLLVDMANALETPLGHGHYYAHRDYVDAWMAVTDAEGWTKERLDALKASFSRIPED